MKKFLFGFLLCLILVSDVVYDESNILADTFKLIGKSTSYYTRKTKRIISKMSSSVDKYGGSYAQKITQKKTKYPSINLNEIIKETNLEKDVFRKNVANSAIECLGIGYKYGGTNKAGFDCSGFVQYIYGKNGVKTPRTVTEMVNSINKTSTPQRGDLIVINGYKHIGIYLNDGNFIHSSSSQGITISNVDEMYYKNKITCYLTVF